LRGPHPWHANRTDLRQPLQEMAMPDAAEARTQHAMQAIAAYIARHPLAADSEAGIAQWWLAEMQTDVPLPDVRWALERLVQQQVLVCTVLADGSAIYRAGPAAAVP
jgi:hypothetical protein